MAKKRRYNDKFRANAVVMLEAAGYPKSGALSQVSQHLSVPLNTLKGWATAASNPVPADVRTEKKAELIDLYVLKYGRRLPKRNGQDRTQTIVT